MTLLIWHARISKAIIALVSGCCLLSFSCQIAFAQSIEVPQKNVQQASRLDRTENNDPVAYGVVLTYYQLPTLIEQSKIRNQYLKQYKLVLQHRLSFLKAFIFLYSKPRALSEVKKLCQKLEKNKNIRYCQPDVEIKPKAQSFSQSKALAGVGSGKANLNSSKVASSALSQQQQKTKQEEGPLAGKPFCEDYTAPFPNEMQTEATDKICAGADCRVPAHNTSATQQLEKLAGDLNNCPIVEAPCQPMTGRQVLDGAWIQSADATKLSPFWGQELVGLDLARQELDEHLTTHKLRSKLVAVLESYDPQEYYDDPGHRIGVTGLITNHYASTALFRSNFSEFSRRPSSSVQNEESGITLSNRGMEPFRAGATAQHDEGEVFGASENQKQQESPQRGAKINFQKFIQSSSPIKLIPTRTAADDALVVDAMGASAAVPSIVNLSRSLVSSHCEGGVCEQGTCELFKSIDTVPVQAAGNAAGIGVNMDEYEAQCAENVMVTVGSMSYSGLVSSFSQEAEGVDVLAPGEFVLTSSKRGRDQLAPGHTGTSFAAPMVTGALAAFVQLSGYKLNTQEAKALLRKTAVPSLSSAFEPPPKKNGAGVLNAYKIARVAQKLKKLCEPAQNFQETKAKSTQTEFNFCVKNKLQDKSTYQFDFKPPDAGRIFSSCGQAGGASTASEASCDDKKQIFKQLRQQAFLNPHKAEAWKSLSCIYKTLGFTENAKSIEATHAAAKKDRDYVNEYIYTQALEDLKNSKNTMAYMQKRDVVKRNEAAVAGHFNYKSDWDGKLPLTQALRATSLLPANKRKALMQEAVEKSYIKRELLPKYVQRLSL